jgi:hypothetical protein
LCWKEGKFSRQYLADFVELTYLIFKVVDGNKKTHSNEVEEGDEEEAERKKKKENESKRQRNQKSRFR